MVSLIPVHVVSDVLPMYRGTPIERMLRYHNLGEPLPPTTGRAEMLVGMCIDHRADLTLPHEFAYVLRAAGGNLRGSEFEISYAVGVGRVSTIALLAHTDCGMDHVIEKRDVFIRGLVEWGGCTEEAAARHFAKHAAHYDIGDPLQFVVAESLRIQRFYPKVMVAPLLYTVEDDLLSQIAGWQSLKPS